MPHILTLPDFHNYEENESLVPLGVLKKFVTNLCSDDEELR